MTVRGISHMDHPRVGGIPAPETIALTRGDSTAIRLLDSTAP